MTLKTRRVIITRTRKAATRFAQELTRLTADGGPNIDLLYVPVHQAQTNEEQTVFNRIKELGAGNYRWVSFTSANGVLALDTLVREYPDLVAQAGLERCAEAPLVRLLGQSRIACVGKAAREALERRGVTVDFVPTVADARHMVSEWCEDPAHLAAGERTVLCVQGTNARDTLSKGLAEQGWTVEPANVYSMSDYPALRPLAPEPATDAAANLSLAQLPPAIGEVTAVVATAPSLLTGLYQRWQEIKPADSFPPVIAIGATTEAHARQLGLTVQKSPTPAPEDLAQTLITLMEEGEDDDSH